MTNSNRALATRFLDVIEHDIVPLTRAGVERGDKVFGGAILRKADLSLVLAATNRETENPLFHGEISTLSAFFALAVSARPAPEDCLFLSTHEPCSLCLSAITWAGGTLVVKHYEWGVSLNALAGWQLLVGLVPITAIAAVSEPFVLHRASLEAALSGLYVLLVGMVMGYALWFRVVRAMPATVASIGAMMIPVIGVASGAILLGEPFGWREVLALALVLSAIALVLFVPARRGGAKPPG
jgi:tRNA(Arg) A34 adenosine deaminase TadA